MEDVDIPAKVTGGKVIWPMQPFFAEALTLDRDTLDITTATEGVSYVLYNCKKLSKKL